VLYVIIWVLNENEYNLNEWLNFDFFYPKPNTLRLEATRAEGRITHNKSVLFYCIVVLGIAYSCERHERSDILQSIIEWNEQKSIFQIQTLSHKKIMNLFICVQNVIRFKYEMFGQMFVSNITNG